MSEDVQRAISAIEVEEIFEGRGEERRKVGEVRKVKFWDKTRALELLGRHVGLIRDRSEENKPPAVFNLILHGIGPREKVLPTGDSRPLLPATSKAKAGQ